MREFAKMTNLDNQKNKSESLKILGEDILRVLGELGNSASLKVIKTKLNDPPSFKEMVEQLDNQGYITVRENTAKLTGKGKETADLLCKKHCIIENYWITKSLKSEEEAHWAAHLLEHHVSKEVIENIKLIFEAQKKGVSLTEFHRKEGIITNLMLEGSMFERLISMGFSPGEKLIIAERLPNAIVIKIKNKKLAIDRNITKHIRVLEEVNTKNEQA